MTLDDSYRHCESVARTQAANFYPAFRVLPRDQRRAMCALYAFMRIADDLSDEPAPLEAKAAQLVQWRRGLQAALAGSPSHPIHAAVADAVSRYRIPVAHLEAVIDGVEMDLEPTAYATFAELRVYCSRVASAVGLACIHVW